MKKEEKISLLLSAIINLVIVFLIPELSNNQIENKKIKIGLVNYDNQNRTKLEGERNSNSSQKKNTEEVKKKNPPPKEQPKVEVKTEKKVEKKVEEKPVGKSTEKIDLSALNSIANDMSTPQVQVMTVKHPDGGYREIIKLEAPKKELQSGVVTKGGLNKEITLSKELISVENEKLELKDDNKIAFNSEIGKDSSFDRILEISGEIEGLPSGYKLGTEDGDIVAKWDSGNKEPVYPESAQLKGLHGSVKIRMNIDENGNVKELRLERGSGVPEINNAIEEVGRTWKIYLSKNGLSVKGDVILEYNFTLKGKVN